MRLSKSGDTRLHWLLQHPTTKLLPDLAEDIAHIQLILLPREQAASHVDPVQTYVWGHASLVTSWTAVPESVPRRLRGAPMQKGRAQIVGSETVVADPASPTLIQHVTSAILAPPLAAGLEALSIFSASSGGMSASDAKRSATQFIQ